MEYVSVTEHEAVSSSCSLYVTGVRGKCACARVTGSRQGRLISGRRLACMSQDEGWRNVARAFFVHLHNSESITITAFLSGHEVHGIR